MDILHVGWNEAYFYYIMELADDVDAKNQNWETYQPRTLRNELKRRGRLSPHECVQLGLALSDALTLLHGERLVHRDIKPSNIIFIGGVPRLADIGLVTSTDDAFSMAGTHGFLPPEGPGTPQADIYSLGMVLYEASTGHKASEFPLPPADLREISESKTWGELNHIILRACARDIRRWYPSVQHLKAALSRVRDGKSVKDEDALLRLFTMLGWATLAAVILTLAGIGARSVWESGARLTNSVSVSWPVTNNIASSVLPPPSPALREVRRLDSPSVSRWPYWPSALPGNWQRYGEPLLFLATGAELNVISGRSYRVQSTLLPLSPGANLSLNFVTDLDGDGSDEVAVSGREGEELFISVLDPSLFEIRRFKAKAEKRTGEFGDKFVNALWAKRVDDLKGNGKKQMFALMGTAYIGGGPKPREVLCFDYETQQPVWKYAMGPFGIALETADLDGDSVKEVLVGTEALSNGNAADDGTDDNHSYLYALNYHGSLLWKRELGGYYTRAYPLVLRANETGHASVLAWMKDAYEFRREHHESENGKILRFDAQGNILFAYDAGLQLASCRVLDDTRDEGQRVLAVDRDGFLHVLNSRLSLMNKTRLVTNRFDRIRAEIAAIADLDRDGKDEFIVTSLQEEGIPQRTECRQFEGTAECPGLPRELLSRLVALLAIPQRRFAGQKTTLSASFKNWRLRIWK